MPSVLFLDDNPARQKRFLQHCPTAPVALSADECIAFLRYHAWDLVFLDHDLGDEVNDDPSGDNTGSAVVRWIVANRPTIGRIVVHSLSQYAPAMRDALIAAGYDAECIGFMTLIERFDEVLASAISSQT